MSNRVPFIIDLQGLNKPTNHFTFVADAALFAHFKSTLLERGNCRVDVEVSRSTILVEVKIHVKGTIELQCDRSLELFDHAIEGEHRFFYKFGEKFDELDDDVYIIPETLVELDISLPVYEFICLRIPFKKLHPKFANEPQTDEETTLIYSTSKTDEIEEQEQPSDPRWDKLKNINNN